MEECGDLVITSQGLRGPVGVGRLGRGDVTPVPEVQSPSATVYSNSGSPTLRSRGEWWDATRLPSSVESRECRLSSPALVRRQGVKGPLNTSRNTCRDFAANRRGTGCSTTDLGTGSYGRGPDSQDPSVTRSRPRNEVRLLGPSWTGARTRGPTARRGGREGGGVRSDTKNKKLN